MSDREGEVRKGAGGTLPAEALHRLHDGDLGADERAALEGSLGEPGSDDRLRLAAIGDVGAAVRATFEAQTAGFDVWAAVERGIRAEPAAAAEGGKVISFRQRLMRARMPMWISTVAAAAAVALLVLLPSRLSVVPSNNCDVEALEVSGATASVLKVPDAHGDGTTTIVWIEED